MEFPKKRLDRPQGEERLKIGITEAQEETAWQNLTAQIELFTKDQGLYNDTIKKVNAASAGKSPTAEAREEILRTALAFHGRLVNELSVARTLLAIIEGLYQNPAANLDLKEIDEWLRDATSAILESAKSQFVDPNNSQSLH